MASATPLSPCLHLPLRLQWWRKVLYQKYLPGPDIQLNPISFLSSPSLPDTRSFFFNPTFTALHTLPAHCQWDFMDSDGCIMNMYAIEIQLCCCLEALYASINVQLHNLKHRDQGTLNFFWSHALWKDNGAIHVEQKWKLTKRRKWIAGILKWSRFTYHANFILTIKHPRKHALKGQTVGSFSMTHNFIKSIIRMLTILALTPDNPSFSTEDEYICFI